MAAEVVIVVDEYRCAPRGSVVEVFRKGDVVEGRVAEWAIAAKAARKTPVKETRNMGGAPENKGA